MISNKIRPLIYLALIALVLWLIAVVFTDIFFYLAVSSIFATVLRPLTERIHQFYFYGIRPPRLVAVIISFLFFGAIVTLLIGLFIPLISEQLQVISRINFENVLERISDPLKSVEAYLMEVFPNLADEGFLAQSFKENIFSFAKKIDVTSILNNIISFTGSIFVSFLAISFITFFFLFEKGLFRRKFISLIPNKYFEVSIAAIFKIERLLSNYLIGLLFQMTAIFSLASIGLTIFNIKYALTIALFAAIANLIPYAGPILGASFGIIVGLSTGGSFEMDQNTIFMMLKIISVFSVVQLTDNIVLQPLIFSKSVKGHPLEIFVIIFAGASLAGVLGMIFAIPVYTVIKVITLELYSGYSRYRVFQK